MIFILAGMIAGIIIGYKSAPRWEKIWTTAIGFIIGIALGTIVAMVFGAIGHKITPDDTKVSLSNTTYIVVLNDNASVSGTFALGSGTINGDMYYSYYEDLGDDKFMLDKIRNTHKVTLETIRDGSRPRIERYDLIWSNAIGIWTDKKTIIFIPDNTIRNGFSLDAK